MLLPPHSVKAVDPLLYRVEFLNLLLVKCVIAVKIRIIPAKTISVPKLHKILLKLKTLPTF